MKVCVTHFCCDCLNEKLNSLQEQVAALKLAMTKSLALHSHTIACETSDTKEWTCFYTSQENELLQGLTQHRDLERKLQRCLQSDLKKEEELPSQS